MYAFVARLLLAHPYSVQDPCLRNGSLHSGRAFPPQLREPPQCVQSPSPRWLQVLLMVTIEHHPWVSMQVGNFWAIQQRNLLRSCCAISQSPVCEGSSFCTSLLVLVTIFLPPCVGLCWHRLALSVWRSSSLSPGITSNHSSYCFLWYASDWTQRLVYASLVL